MAVGFEDLVPEFRSKLAKLLVITQKAGIETRPYFTVRSPFEQARLWRHSRSAEQIAAKIAEFKQSGAPFLAQCLESVGPQHGDPVTNAPPGLSWHQWGEAVDCFWLVDGAAEWSTQKLVNKKWIPSTGRKSGVSWVDGRWPLDKAQGLATHPATLCQ